MRLGAQGMYEISGPDSAPRNDRRESSKGNLKWPP